MKYLLVGIMYGISLSVFVKLPFSWLGEFLGLLGFLIGFLLFIL